MATVQSLMDMWKVLVFGWFITIIMLLTIPLASDQVQYALFDTDFIQDVSGEWAEVTTGKFIWSFIYVVCFFPGGISTALAILYSTKKQQFQQQVEFSGGSVDNQFGSFEEME